MKEFTADEVMQMDDLQFLLYLQVSSKEYLYSLGENIDVCKRVATLLYDASAKWAATLEEIEATFRVEV